MTDKNKLTNKIDHSATGDTELTTPDHDRLMVLLDACANSVVRAMWPIIDLINYPFLKKREDQPIKDENLKRIGWAVRATKKQWEIPVKRGNGFICGYIDFSAVVQTFEFNYDKITGVCDRPRNGEFKIHFEVKPRIRSLGELLRQLQTYRDCVYCTDDVIAVFTDSIDHDHPWAKLIRNNGFGFFNPKTLSVSMLDRNHEISLRNESALSELFGRLVDRNGNQLKASAT